MDWLSIQQANDWKRTPSEQLRHLQKHSQPQTVRGRKNIRVSFCTMNVGH